MTFKEYADFLLPNVTHDINYYEEKYPSRNLSDNAQVTRFAPSPTGFVHFGSLFTAFVASKVAKQTNGVFYLRIEDTDQKRTVLNGVNDIIKDLKNYGISIDEGMTSENTEIGNYGPYIQSMRKEIYQTYAHYLIENNLAYPSFQTAEELEKIKEEQELNKDRIGYYGRWANDRNLTKEEVIERIKNGEKYIIRLKSNGNYNKKIILDDKIRGRVEFPENDLDVVLIKQDGLPTYHFAHAIDDHLMRTTTIIRGDEWLSSFPIHYQLFQVLGFKGLKYAHVSPIMKIDNGNKRKLSKRKDKEAAVSFYHEKGIPTEAVKIYIMTVANSNFEMWYEQNTDKTIDDFRFEFKKMSASGALFDLDKLYNISKNYLSRISAEEVFKGLLNWTSEFDLEFNKILIENKDYATSILNIERCQKKPRKDYSCYSEIKEQIWYMFDSLWDNNKILEWDTIKDIDEIKNILNIYIEKYYDEKDDKDTWFNKMKLMCEELGYASNMKDYKENKKMYKGSVSDVSMVIRIALTSKKMTPDLYEIMKLLKIERIKERIKNIK